MTSPHDSAALGALVATYPYDPDQRQVTLFVGLGFIGLAIAFPVLYWLDPVAVGPAVYFSPVVAIGAILALAHWAYTGGVSLAVHTGGFVHGTHVVPFARIRGLRYRLVQVIGGSASYNRGFFEVRLDDGRVVKTSMQLAKMDEVIGRIVGGAEPVLVSGIAGALAAGHVVRSGPFELHRDGIVCKGKSIPWARVALSSGAAEPTLQLRDCDPDTGDSTVVTEAKLEKLENASALEAVADQLRREAIRNRPR